MKLNPVAYKCDSAWSATAEFKPIEPRQHPGSGMLTGYVTRKEANYLLASNLAAAEARARRALAWHADNNTAKYLLGAALRRTGRLQEARAVLAPLIRLQPQFSAAWSELGFALQGLGETAEAVDAHLHAISLDPLDEDAWYALGDILHFPVDDEYDAEEDADGVPLKDAAMALREDRFEEAESLLRPAIESRTNNPKALKLLADVLIWTERWTDAKPLLDRSLELAPRFLRARFRYGAMLVAHREYGAAMPHIDELLRSAPGRFVYRLLKAIALEGTEDHERAMSEYKELMEGLPNQPGLWMQYADIIKTHHPEKAPVFFDDVLLRFPLLVDASYALATVKSFRFDNLWIERIQKQFDQPDLDVELRAKLNFVLGKAFEDVQDYARSFEHYKASNEILRALTQSNRRSTEQFTWLTKTIFTRRFIQQRASTGCADAGAIFIVGLPRSGSTLVEQMLSSHSRIEGLGELGGMPTVISQLGPNPSAYPRFLKNLELNRFRRLGEEYMALTRARQKSCKPFFTDKLPINYAHSALIHLILPNARIVDVRRHPLDCGFSCYKHYFDSVQERALGRRSMGRWYSDYVELMAHFDDLLPGRIHRVIYEQLVENPEKEVRRLLDYVGLPFEEQCLRFYETERVVDTISAEQVRMPLYKSGIGHWRHYEQWLGPMKEELGRVLALYPDPPKFFPRLRVRVASAPLGVSRVFRLFKGTGQLPFEQAEHAKALSARA